MILDPCSGDGRLTSFFPNSPQIISFEKKHGTDFLAHDEKIQCDLVIANPPWNENNPEKRTRQLLPEVFLKKIISLVPEGTPIIALIPMGLRLNVRDKSQRLKWLSTLQIDSVITIPLNAYDNVLFHNEGLILNAPRLRGHYSFHPDQQIHKSLTHSDKLNIALENFKGVDKTFYSICRNITFSCGMTDKNSAKLLSSLMYFVDRDCNIKMNVDVRNQLSKIVGTSTNVINNLMKKLVDAKLLVTEKRGLYKFTLINNEQIKCIIDSEYTSLFLEMDYVKSSFIPIFNIHIKR